METALQERACDPGVSDTVLSVQRINALVQQISLVKDLKQKVMVNGHHYGIIPGTAKPTLYKAGAELLCKMFNLRVECTVETKDLGNNHKEYLSKISLFNPAGELITNGYGTCATLESKYRYRKSSGDNTGQLLPKEYWKEKKNGDPKKAANMIGGHGFFPKKTDGTWFIYSGSSDKVENPDPADLWNTCLKMSKKRALVDASLTGTASSDLFAEDIEETVGNSPKDRII